VIRTELVRDLSEHVRFDTILYVDVLEHIEDDREELAAATRHLRNRGHLVVIGPAHGWLFSEFDTAVGHCRRYSRSTLSAAVPELMTPRRLRYLDSLGVALSAANRLLLRSASPSRRQIAFWDQWVVPFSKRLDPLLGWRVGKSVVGVWQR
jgi:2-polyprenyl-3-methyl-5-hydroxy-6-metoxy-1,4-benzoquinol methylase